MSQPRRGAAPLLALIVAVGLMEVAKARLCFVYERRVERANETVALCNGLGLAEVPAPPSPPSSQRRLPSALVLDQNVIVSLYNDSFSAWPALWRLSVVDNRLTNISAGALSGLVHLRRLDLRRNALTFPRALSPGSLPGGLELLDLSHNPLGVLPGGQFRGLDRLRVLRLVDAQIAVLQSDWLAGLSGVHSLNLFNNRIRSLPQLATRHRLSSMTQLSAIRLGGTNPWACDCRVRWLKEWLARRAEVTTDTPVYAPRGPVQVVAVCASPPRMRGRPVFSPAVPIRELHCAPDFRGRNLWAVAEDVKLFGVVAMAWLLALVGVAGAVTFVIFPNERFRAVRPTSV